MSWPQPKHDITVSGKNIPSDEPLFLLRAQDRHAPDAVDAYADDLEQTAQDLPNDERLDLVEQAIQCRAFALQMRRWQAENPESVKSPD